MDQKRTEHCMVCGSPLEYLQQSEQLACTYCRNREQASIKCPHGHFICEACHTRDSRKMIEDLAFTTELKNPVEIAELMMSHPALPMLGCEHALIAAGALLAALRNSPYAKVTNHDIHEVFSRTSKQAVGGYCGLTGVCGITPAIGACFSVFLGSRCGSDMEQKITMDAAVKVSQGIIELTGPSCCKAYVRSALAAAVAIFAERFGITFPAAKASVVCKDSNRHPHGCREDKCPYYHKPSKDIFAESTRLPVTVCQS